MIIHIIINATCRLSSRASNLFYQDQKHEICLLNETVPYTSALTYAWPNKAKLCTLS